MAESLLHLHPSAPKISPCTMVVFGAAGDLSRRKLYPALCNLRSYGVIPDGFAVIGVGRRDYSDEAYRAEVAKGLSEFVHDSGSKPGCEREVLKQTFFSAGDFDSLATYQKLKAKLEEVSGKCGTGANVIFYLATPPEAFSVIVERLGAAGLTRQSERGWRRVVIEKPFGRDLASAQALNRAIRSMLDEEQIYRIDHYLGKETVQNLLAVRFANGVFEPTWNRHYVDHVQISVAETLAVEGRGKYYDSAGVLRDMMQNHMFQLMALLAMEPPSSLGAEAVRNEKVKVFEAIRPFTPEEVDAHAVRGQYGGYRDEPDVARDSMTETFAALKLQINNWRWADVPFFLRSGKRLARRETEIVIQYRCPPLSLFPEDAAHQVESNRLVIRIQPDEGIALHVKAKVPGPTLNLATVRLDFSYRDFGHLPETTGYEQLLYDCMDGDSSLFHREDMVEAAWRIATPILDRWASRGDAALPIYAPGSWGPQEADRLIVREGRSWSHHHG